VLSDAIEAMLGALYISDGLTPEGSQVVFDRLFKPFYDRHVRLQTLSHHPNKILAELLQRQGCHDFHLRKSEEDEATLLRSLNRSGIAAAASCAGRENPMGALLPR
jgi:endoribonuclease Dicer